MIKIKNIFGAIGSIFFVLYVGSASAWIEVSGEPVTTPLPVVNSIIVKFAEIEGQKRGKVDIAAMKQQIFDMSDVNFENKDSSLSETLGTFVFQITEEDGARLQRQGSDHIESMLDALVLELNQDPAIEVAEKNTIFYVQEHSPGKPGSGESREPNDTLYKSEQWHYQGETIVDDMIRSRGVNLPLAWGHHTIGSEDTVIAVVDTGIAKSYYGDYHENLEGKILDGYNFVELGQPPIDNGGLHGTHVAGTIAAKTNHRLRVAGVDWHAKLLPVRVLDDFGSGSMVSVMEGIAWAANLGNSENDTPAQVINLSLGAPESCGILMQTVVDAAIHNGVVVVVAAGNSNYDTRYFSPASCEGVIAVAATDREANRAWFSNYGDTVAVAAPGVDVFSTYAARNGYEYASGTSMASPHIAGIVGLMLSVNGELTPSEVKEILQDEKVSVPIDNLPFGSSFGLVDAHKAVRAAVAKRLS